MISSKITNPLSKCINIFSHTKPRYSISTSFYQLIKNQHFFIQPYKPSNLYFRNEGTVLTPYLYSATITNIDNEQGQHSYSLIPKKNMFVLNFVPEIDQDMNQDPWSLRKIVNFDLENSYKLTKVGPNKQSNIAFQTINELQNQQKVINNITVDYSKDYNSITMQVETYKKKEDEKQQLWSISFVFTLNEYQVLLHWIKTGIYYASGAALMVQKSLEEQLRLASNCEPHYPSEGKKKSKR